ADQRGGLAQEGAAFDRRFRPPLLEALVGGATRVLEIGARRDRHLSNRQAGCRIPEIQRLARGAVAPHAIDVKLNRLAHLNQSLVCGCSAPLASPATARWLPENVKASPARRPEQAGTPRPRARKPSL